MSDIGNGLSRAERETIIRRADDEDTWTVYTSSPVVARRLAKLAHKVGFRLVPVGDHGVEATLPKAAISFRTPRQISDAERERLAGQLAARRAETGE